VIESVARGQGLQMKVEGDSQVLAQIVHRLKELN